MNVPTLRRAEPADWQQFSRWAAAENWTLLPLEASLYFRHAAGVAYALTLGEETVGIVTTLRHGKSAWIGNLMVAPAQRRRGLGEQLFEVALKGLLDSGVETVWLTASEMGRDLYERHGFIRVNRVYRWSQAGVGTAGTDAAGVPLDELLQADAAAWSDDRSGLLTMLAGDGTILGRDRDLVLLQQAGAVCVAGPWLSGGSSASGQQRLLRDLVTRTPATATLIIDVLSTSPVNRLLPQAGFHYRGGNELMALGAVDAVRVEQIVALASLGSCG